MSSCPSYRQLQQLGDDSQTSSSICWRRLRLQQGKHALGRKGLRSLKDWERAHNFRNPNLEDPPEQQQLLLLKQQLSGTNHRYLLKLHHPSILWHYKYPLEMAMTSTRT